MLGIFTAAFTEVINASSVQLASLYLIDSNSSSSGAVAIFNASVESLDDVVLSIKMGPLLLNLLKLRGLFLQPSRAFICFGLFVNDMFGNSIAPQSCTTAIKVSSYVGDVVQPMVTDFRFSWTNPVTFSVKFNEPLDALAINVSSLVLISSLTNRSVEVRTSDAVDVYSVNGMTVSSINITISDRLADALHLTRICLSADSCSLQILQHFVTDVSGNALPALLVSAQNVLPDTIAPQLLGADVNMDSGIFARPRLIL